MDNDTDKTWPPDASLPSFEVNVTPTNQISATHLHNLLKNFSAGNNEPLIFGENGRAQAAVIPFSAFIRLMKADHSAYLHAENTFQHQLSQRLATQTDQTAQPTTLEDQDDFDAWVTASFDQLGADWVDKNRRRHD